jgi:phosphopantothenoylcysteine decarboxylase/phosphopantothenate--cysteine ligase
MKLKNKRILITAGPTWVPIDSVRVISNIATGQTGVLLAQEAVHRGFKVTLLLGPGDYCCLRKGIRVIRFRFFDELRQGLKKELGTRRYDFIIHSAAVADFKPARVFKRKLSSQKTINLKLKPLPKVFQDIRKVSPESRLAIFKLESRVSDKTLIQRAKVAQQKSGAEIVVANRLNPYCAFIINKSNDIVSAESKKDLVRALLRCLTQNA